MTNSLVITASLRELAGLTNPDAYLRSHRRHSGDGESRRLHRHERLSRRRNPSLSDNGWIYHGYAIVSKNPQAQAIRTHSKALLFVQVRKDSTASRPAILDRVLFFYKPGENQVPVTPVDNGEMTNDTWINWAGGIWTGVQIRHAPVPKRRRNPMTNSTYARSNLAQSNAVSSFTATLAKRS